MVHRQNNFVAFWTPLTTVFVVLQLWHSSEAKTSVDLYYETLCPDSRKFVNNQLYPVYQKHKDKLDIDLIPFGIVGVSMKDDGVTPAKFACQHGPEECLGNKIHVCVIKKCWEKDRDSVMAFVNCMFASANWRSVETAGQECADKIYPNEWNDIINCAKGDEGRKQYREMWKKHRAFEQLNGEISWIPTVIINKGSSHSQKAEHDLESQI